MKNRILVGFIAASGIPPLGALLTVTTATIGDVTFWLHIATILIASIAAAAIYVITLWNSDVGNPAIPVPGSITTTVVKIPATPVVAPVVATTSVEEPVIGMNTST